MGTLVKEGSEWTMAVQWARKTVLWFPGRWDDFLQKLHVHFCRASCWQPGTRLSATPGVSEDCLYLSVFVPQNVVSSGVLAMGVECYEEEYLTPHQRSSQLPMSKVLYSMTTLALVPSPLLLFFSFFFWLPKGLYNWWLPKNLIVLHYHLWSLPSPVFSPP